MTITLFLMKVIESFLDEVIGNASAAKRRARRHSERSLRSVPAYRRLGISLSSLKPGDDE